MKHIHFHTDDFDFTLRIPSNDGEGKPTIQYTRHADGAQMHLESPKALEMYDQLVIQGREIIKALLTQGA